MGKKNTCNFKGGGGGGGGGGHKEKKSKKKSKLQILPTNGVYRKE